MMKLKLDENGNPVLQDGKPVYVYDDGKEVAYDVPQAVSKITALNAEAKKYREEKEALEKKLSAFDGLDIEKAKQAIETVKNLDDKKLLDAGEVEKVKNEIVKQYEVKLSEKDAEIQKAYDNLQQEVIGGAFARSSYILEKMSLPADMVQAYFGKHFIYENGKVIAKDNLGNQIFSRKSPGEPADFDEALEHIVSCYPQKDHILKASGNAGGGSGSGASGSDFKNPWSSEHWNMTEQAKIFKESPDKARQLAVQAGKEISKR
ncbi:DUF6651 domain-containing protein [Bisgaard Taxon 45]